MSVVSRVPYEKPWRERRHRVSVLAEMALRKEKVTQRLRELRELHGLTQDQAAARVGINLRQWQRWEAGDSMPYPRNLDTIASAFGITVAEFFDPPPRVAVDHSELGAVREQLARLDDHISALQNGRASGVEQLLERQSAILERLEAMLERIEARIEASDTATQRLIAAATGEPEPPQPAPRARAANARAKARRDRAGG